MYIICFVQFRTSKYSFASKQNVFNPFHNHCVAAKQTVRRQRKLNTITLWYYPHNVSRTLFLHQFSMLYYFLFFEIVFRVNLYIGQKKSSCKCTPCLGFLPWTLNKHTKWSLTFLIYGMKEIWNSTTNFNQMEENAVLSRDLINLSVN